MSLDMIVSVVIYMVSLDECYEGDVRVMQCMFDKV